MAVLVAYGPEGRGNSALDLGRLVASSASRSLVVCCVVPDRWEAVGPGRRVDDDYQQHLRSLADQALETARARVGSLEVPLVEEVVTARSVPAGLLDAAGRHEASMLVVGSSSGGAWGHIALGSVSDRLLHSATVPVALAPRGLRLRHGGRVPRVSVAMDGTPGCFHVLESAASLAADLGARLRLVTFAVRARTMVPAELGLHIEDRVVDEWRRQTHEEVSGALQQLGDPGADAEVLVVDAANWAEALDEPDWADGEILVVGSSASESVWSRVFLGSTATRIVRHSPVPIVVVP